MPEPKMIRQDYEAEVALERLTPHPANPNQGDTGLLCEVLDANGFAGAVLAQKSTGILIDGETRLNAAKSTGLKTLPVIWCDVDDDTRDRLLAEYNETARRGTNDERKLLALLTGLSGTPLGLTGTGFDGDDVDRLRAQLHAPLVINDAPTGATYSETDEQLASRQEVNSNYRDRKDGGNLIEMILVFSTDERREVGELLDAARSAKGLGDDWRASDIILQSLRVFTAMAEGNVQKAEAILDAPAVGDAG